MLRVPSIKELTYKCKHCGFTNIKRKSIAANPESWGVSRGITQIGSYPLATPTPDTFDVEILTGGQFNHILNSDMESWPAGASDSPDNWSLVPGTVARENSIIHNGSYSVKLTSSVGEKAYIFQDIDTTLGIAYWQGKTITMGCWAYSENAATAAIVLYDGVSGYQYAFHPGGSVWAWLSLTIVVDIAATMVIAYISTELENSITYFDQAVLVEGSSIDRTILTEGSSIQHNKISFTAATSSTPATINDASCRFADLGFVPGDTIIISTTSGTNDGTYTLAQRGGITNGSLSLSSADSLTTESANAAGTVTLSIRTYKPNITTGCPFCGSLNSR